MGNQKSSQSLNDSARSSEATHAAGSNIDAEVIHIRLPTVVGAPAEAPRSIVDELPEVTRAVCEHVPPSLRESWRLLYSTSIDGRSFPKLVRCICNAGPTLVLIRQRSPSGGDALVIGGFNTSSWKTVAERSGQRQPAGTGNPGGVASGKAKQDSLFFGDDRCFALVATVTQENLVKTLAVHRGTARSNANFMYLCDKHNEPKRIGLGMGGRPGYCAWFVDEVMDRCVCRAPTCPTFEGFSLPPESFSSDLSCTSEATDAFEIAALEVYGLEPRGLHPEQQREMERRALVKRYAMDSAGCSDENGQKASILRRGDAATIRAVLELADVHQFRSEGDESCGGHAC